ncbi:hypothetical protein [Phocoenobacter atlanticus]|uniref:hypothetical protein n=1 Tax=Phocoenobacter atlanticus TaxID=3416742 RepID=UPI0027546E62|nr:hypothetical protein [Pasteurella atlantica]MDP8117683.1 hypothetical protein [Pasteurella atlantica]
MCYNLSSAVSTVTENDTDGDGNPETFKKVIQDNIIFTQDDGQSRATTIENATISYNDDGTKTITYKIDKYGNGKLVQDRIDTIDGDDNVSKSITYEHNDLSGLKQEIVTTYTYEDGMVKTKSIDNVGEERDLTITYTYTPEGDVKTEKHDYINHDKWDHVQTNNIVEDGLIKSYDLSYTNGNEISVEQIFEDGKKVSKISKKDGAVIEDLNYLYNNEDGHLIKSNDINDLRYYINIYDDMEHKVKFIYDNKQNDAKDYSLTYNYDEHIHVSSQYESANRSYIDYHKYNDEKSSKIMDVRDDNVDGSIDKIFVQRSLTLDYQDEYATVKEIQISDVNNNLLTISDETLTNIITNNGADKLVIKTSREHSALDLGDSFIKTGEKEIYEGKNYIKYADDSGLTVIVEPDIDVI